MLPAGQLTDASYGAVDTAQPRAIALTPDHAFMIGRRNLATVLDECAVGIEQELRVIDRAAIALVDADGDDHAGLLGGLADSPGSVGWVDKNSIPHSLVLADARKENVFRR